MKALARTKIVATIGPASSTPETIGALIDAGVSVFRMNFSHGDHATHETTYRSIRRISEEKGRAIGILQDLQGPKLRIGDLAGDAPVVLQEGHTFRICTRDIAGTAEMASTSYERFGLDLSPGDPVLIDDGKLRFVVTEIEHDTDHGDIVSMHVIQGGELSPRKGINLPQTDVTEPALTEKDREDRRGGHELESRAHGGGDDVTHGSLSAGDGDAEVAAADEAAGHACEPLEVAQGRRGVEIELLGQIGDLRLRVRVTAAAKLDEGVARHGGEHVHDVRRHQKDEECGDEAPDDEGEHR